jgi:MFS family permease
MVLWLTVVAYMITYMDRVVMSAALPSIQEEFGFSKQSLSWVTGAFRWGYALFQVPGGWFGDLIGPRRALTAIVIWWSLFTSLTGLARGLWSLITIRFLFGVGEAGAFPIATRSLSRWMLPGERGFAQGITHAGSRLGAAITPIIVVQLILSYGWRAPFIIFGLFGLGWAAIWFFWYRDTPQEHTWVNEGELKLIESELGKPKPKSRSVPWRVILSSSTVRTLALMYACYAWSIAIYLDWFPKYLTEARGLDLKTMGLYASLPLLAATVGDFVGGWLSDRIAVRTGNLKFARQSVAIAGFLIAAAGIVPATLASSAELCVLLTCVGVFGLEATVGVSWAIPLDIGRDYAGSVSAVMNTCGNIGGAISTTVLGYLVAAAGWASPFLIGAALCVVAAAMFLRIDPSKEITYSQEARP